MPNHTLPHVTPPPGIAGAVPFLRLVGGRVPCCFLRLTCAEACSGYSAHTTHRRTGREEDARPAACPPCAKFSRLLCECVGHCLSATYTPSESGKDASRPPAPAARLSPRESLSHHFFSHPCLLRGVGVDGGEVWLLRMNYVFMHTMERHRV